MAPLKNSGRVVTAEELSHALGWYPVDAERVRDFIEQSGALRMCWQEFVSDYTGKGFKQDINSEPIVKEAMLVLRDGPSQSYLYEMTADVKEEESWTEMDHCTRFVVMVVDALRRKGGIWEDDSDFEGLSNKANLILRFIRNDTQIIESLKQKKRKLSISSVPTEEEEDEKPRKRVKIERRGDPRHWMPIIYRTNVEKKLEVVTEAGVVTSSGFVPHAKADPKAPESS
ncbi:hypothetical protein VTL71DRAFT_12985 [Oculimacula yallundae]|uniref:Uncharacterized protein n=1 Tax=Oculimacula yallundae TaxID=86028 RepID=A0ABR4CP49_9HELO